MYEPQHQQHQRRLSNPLALYPSGIFDPQIHDSIPDSVTLCFDQLRNEVQKLVEDDRELRSHSRSLESELGVYKNAYSRLDIDCQRYNRERFEYERQIVEVRAEMQRQIDDLKLQLKGQGHRITVLIDGDGTIFEEQLIAQGQAGGQAAAKTLSESVTQYLTQNHDTYQFQIRVYVFLNKRGLADTLGRAGFSAAKARFDDFIMGFNLAAERFIMVDVGSAKEAADAKIKALLEDEIKLPQTDKIIFAGCHDNGYATALRSQITAGFKNKLILLQGYSDMAAGMTELDLPYFSIPDLFMSKKLVVGQPSGVAGSSLAPAAPAVLSPPQSAGLDHETSLEFKSPAQQAFEALPFAASIGAETSAAKRPPASYSSAVQMRVLKVKPKRATTPELDSSSSTSSSDDDEAIITNARAPLTVTRPRRLNPNVPLSKQKPPPCTLFYLSNCKHGADCKYGHDYELTSEHYDEIRVNAKKSPCPSKNKGEICLWNEDCCYGHHCPLTTKCHFFKQNRCKFIGADMHKEQKMTLAEVL